MVRFLVSDDARIRKNHRRRYVVYGEHCTSLTRVHEWQKRFRGGRTSLQDDPQPGQAHRGITHDVIALIDDIIQVDRRITEEENGVPVEISHGSVNAMHGHRFNSNEEMQELMRLWIRQQPNSFYKTEIDRLVS